MFAFGSPNAAPAPHTGSLPRMIVPKPAGPFCAADWADAWQLPIDAG